MIYYCLSCCASLCPPYASTLCRSSRLHFIGSWKARVEALMADHLLQQQQQVGPRPAGATAAAAAAAASGGGGGGAGGQQALLLGGGLGSKRAKGPAGSAAARRVIVHIDMDAFFASVATVGRPEFAGVREGFRGQGWVFGRCCLEARCRALGPSIMAGMGEGQDDARACLLVEHKLTCAAHFQLNFLFCCSFWSYELSCCAASVSV